MALIIFGTSAFVGDAVFGVPRRTTRIFERLDNEDCVCEIRRWDAEDGVPYELRRLLFVKRFLFHPYFP
jgi:hypothetical protein